MTKPLTILQVLPALHSGGVEQGTLEIAAALVKAGHTALVASKGGQMVAPLEASGAQHITLPLSSKNPLTIWQNAARLEQVIRARGVNVVHARSRAPAWSAWLAARRAGVPFVTTFHAAYLENFPGKKFYNSVMVKGDRVIAISQFIVDHITARWPQVVPKLRLVFRGADYNRYDPAKVTETDVAALRSRWNVPAGVPVIMGVGRLSRTKGQDVLLRALARLKDLNWVCVLVGGDQGRTSVSDDLKALAQQGGIADRVIFAGDCREMPVAYRLADVITAPSLVPEAFGRMPVEAQAMERLIITSAIGATVETVLPGKTGWLVPPGDDAALALALREFFALSANERRSRELSARAHVRSKFDTAIMCEKTLAVYAELTA